MQPDRHFSVRSARRKPRKGIETLQYLSNDLVYNSARRKPRKGIETERRGSRYNDGASARRKPRKGIETLQYLSNDLVYNSARRKPRKGIETTSPSLTKRMANLSTSETSEGD